jgi:hypothetical protein
MCLFSLGCSEASIPEESPISKVRFDYYGAEYHSSTVTLPDPHQTLWAQEIVENYHSTRKSDEPEGFKPVALDPSCRLPRPSRAAEVTSIQIYQGALDLPLHFVPIEEKEVTKENEETEEDEGRKKPLIKRWKSTHRKKSPVKKVDVYVTETRHPVYLILSAYSRTLWVLHLAEKVQLDGVAIVGNEAQALAHLPESARVGFVTQNPIQAACYELVARPVDETWTSLPRMKDKRSGKTWRKVIGDAREEQRKFRIWLQWRIDSPDTVITAYSTSHVLVGPKPKIRLHQRPLAETTILHTPQIKPLWG